MRKDFAYAMREPDRNNGTGGTDVIDRPVILTGSDEKVELPKQYHVILLNDDYTPGELVEDIIMEVFGFERGEARRKTMMAHRTGRALMGTFVKDIADTKANKVSELARADSPEWPLRCEVQEAPGSGS